MKASRLTGYGPSSSLEWIDIPDPVAGDGVLVRIYARAINPIDIWTRQGLLADATPLRHLPTLLGWDFAGEVAAGGAGHAVGDRVFGMIPWISDAANRGSYAELALLDSRWLAQMPDGLDYADASLIGLNGLTAAQAMDELNIVDGDRILVTGASGTVGGYATQLAKRYGADVTALASFGDEAYVQSLGPSRVVSLQNRAGTADQIGLGMGEEFRFDGVIDTADIGDSLTELIRPGGTLVSTGNLNTGTTVGYVHRTPIRAHVDPLRSAELAHLASQGALVSRIARGLDLSKASLGHDLTEARASRGKVILTSN